MKSLRKFISVLNILMAVALLVLTIKSIEEFNVLYNASWTIKTPVGNVLRWLKSSETDTILKMTAIALIVVIDFLLFSQFVNSIKKKRGFVSIVAPFMDICFASANMILLLNNDQIWSLLKGFGKDMITYSIIFGIFILLDAYIGMFVNKKIDAGEYKKVEVKKPAPQPVQASNSYNNYNVGNYPQNNNFNQQQNYNNQVPNGQPNPYMIGANDIVLNITVGPAGNQQTQRIILNTQNGYPASAQIAGAGQNVVASSVQNANDVNVQQNVQSQPTQNISSNNVNQNYNLNTNTNTNTNTVEEVKTETTSTAAQNINAENESRPRDLSLNRNLNYDDDDEEDNTYDRSRGMSMNSLLAPSKVHAPAARHSQRNLGREALEAMSSKEIRQPTRSESGISFARTEKDEAASSAAKDLSKNVDLSAFGINIDDIKTEEDYKAALEKILGGGLSKPVVEEEEEIEPDENDLDYELQQVEDSDLNDDEIRELKLIIGDPSNMTFIEKFEKADEDIRKKYLKLRYILLSSKEKRLFSRITRYFDSYYYRGRIVARITIQGKTIKLFLALNPKDYSNTKFSISDESSKLIYRSVPTLIRVRTDMSYAKGKKLISDMLNKKDSDMYEAPEVKFEEKKVDLNPKPIVTEEPVKVEPVKEEPKVEEVVTQSPQVEQVQESKPTITEEVKEESVEVSQPVEEPKEESVKETKEETNNSNEPTDYNKNRSDDDYDDEPVNRIAFKSKSIDELLYGTRRPSRDDNVKEFNIEYDDDGNEIRVDEDGNRVDENGNPIKEPEEVKPTQEIKSNELEEEYADDTFDDIDVEDDKENEDSYSDSETYEDDSEDANEDDSDEDDEEDSESSDEDSDEEVVSKPKNPFGGFPKGDGTSPAAPRKSFAEKIVYGEESTKQQYSELKSLLISYGMKSRVARSNETFRFKKELFVKITVQGKSLKVFLALNPEDYFDSKFPLKDMSYKSSYAQVPVMIKVRSNLSFKRAKILVEELMAKKGILQGIYTDINYAELLEIGL